MKEIEVLMSTMEIKNEEEFIKKIKDSNIQTSITIVNQAKEDNKKVDMENNKNQRIYSYSEIGASKSRNRLINLAKGDICIFADDDIKYVNGYENIIKKAYESKQNADGILFYVENTNKNREKNKKLGNKRFKFLDVMKGRIYELSLTKEALEKIKEKNIKFDNKFGPGGEILKGEDTIFLADLLKNKFNLYCVNEKIGTVGAIESTWFTDFNEKYLYDQGAVLKKIAPNAYKILILQYVIRKHKLYKKNFNRREAYSQMIRGANDN